MKKLMLLFFITFMLFGCKSIYLKQKPSATIENFDIYSVGMQDITFVYDVKVTNPYPIALTLSNVKLQMNVEGGQFLKTETQSGFKIKENATKTSKFYLKLKYEDIISVIKDYSKKDELDCKTSIILTIPLPKIPGVPRNYSFNFVNEMKIPAVKPTIKIVNFKVKTPTSKEIKNALKRSGLNVFRLKSTSLMVNNLLKGRKPKFNIKPQDIDLKIKVEFDIQIKNKTRAKLHFEDLEYVFYIDGEQLISGKTNKIKKRRGAYILTISNSFSTKTVGENLRNFFKKRNGEFTLKGHTYLKFPDTIKKDAVKIVFNETGKLKIRR